MNPPMPARTGTWYTVETGGPIGPLPPPHPALDLADLLDLNDIAPESLTGHAHPNPRSVSAQSPSPDARWRPWIALLAVGALCTFSRGPVPMKAGRSRADGAGRTPSAWNGWWESPQPGTPIIPRWKPEDVEALLDQYEEQLTRPSRPSIPPCSRWTRWHSSEAPFSAPSTPFLRELQRGRAPCKRWPDRPPLAERSALRSRHRPKTVAGTDGRDWLPGGLRIGFLRRRSEAFHRLFGKLDRGGGPRPALRRQSDRGRSHFRHPPQRWQERWGGYGPGIQPPVRSFRVFPSQGAQRFGGSATPGSADATLRTSTRTTACWPATPQPTPPPWTSCIEVGRERRSPGRIRPLGSARRVA